LSLNPGDESVRDKLQEIEEAYKVLSNSNHR